MRLLVVTVRKRQETVSMTTLFARWNRLRRSPRFPYLLLLLLLVGGALSQVYSYWWGRRIQHLVEKSAGYAERDLIFSGNLRSTIGSENLEPLEPIRSIALNGQMTTPDHHGVHTVEDLRELKWLPFLQSLNLQGELTPEAWVALTELRQLKTLSVNEVPEFAYASLGKMNRLTTLTFQFDPYTPPSAIRQIARLPNLKVLTIFSREPSTVRNIPIPANTIDDQMRELARSRSLSRLQASFLDDSSLLALTECRDEEQLLNLTELRLAGSTVSNAGLENLSRLPSLVHLDLNRSTVTDEGLVSLQSIPWLRTLYLEGCRGITDTGADQVAEMTRLESLNVTETSLTRTGLLKLGALKRLRSLWISESNRADTVIPQLRHEFSPLCRIRRSLEYLPMPNP